MDYRPLGNSGLQVSVLGMGCGRLARRSKRSVRLGSIAAARAALENGVNFFDTADCYSAGLSERILGYLTRGRRSDVVIATKCGRAVSPASRLSTGWRASTCFDPDYVVRALEHSLRRLRMDYVDVFLLHSPPLSVLEHGDAVAALLRARDAGKTRAVGVSLRSGAGVESLRVLRGLDCVELELNRASLPSTLQLASELQRGGVGVIARQPFGSGVLLREGGVGVTDCLTFALGCPCATVVAGMSSRSQFDRNSSVVAKVSMTAERDGRTSTGA